MKNGIKRNLFVTECKALSEQCETLTKEMEAFMSNELDCMSAEKLKAYSLEQLFEIQHRITEIDCICGLLDGDDKLQSALDHANLVERLLGTLEQLDTIFNA